MSVSRARSEAFRGLLRIERDRAFSSEILAGVSDDISPEDRALMTAILLGTLRKRPALDAFVSRNSRKPIEKIDGEVLEALRIGLFQIFELDSVPAHAAVNESVNLVRKHGKRSATGFVNAILRNAVKESEAGLRLNEDDLFTGVLFDRWKTQYGAKRAKDFVRWHSLPPNKFFRFTKNFLVLSEAEQAKFVESLPGLEESRMVPHCYRVGGLGQRVRELNEKGLTYFQDESSQFVGYFVSRLKGSSFWDVCAAPGGKSTLAANGFDFTFSTEIYPRRALMMAKLAEQQGSELNVIAADGLLPPFEFDQKFDVVLVDAPCSGTGTVRSNPEIRYTFDENSLQSLQDKQLRLLNEASKSVESGGFLVFSTCSLEKEEGELASEKFLENSKLFTRSDGFDGSGLQNGERRLSPSEKGGEGFYVACFERSC